MDRLVKVAMPATAATVVVPERVPPGPLLMARVTLEVAPVRLPPASRTRTGGDGVMVAGQATAATVVVPERVPPGPLLMARVTLEVAPVRLPPASRTRTVGDGVMVAVETVAVGCWPKTTWVGVPTEMAKLEETAWVNTPSVAARV